MGTSETPERLTEVNGVSVPAGLLTPQYNRFVAIAQSLKPCEHEPGDCYCEVPQQLVDLRTIAALHDEITEYKRHARKFGMPVEDTIEQDLNEADEAAALPWDEYWRWHGVEYCWRTRAILAERRLVENEAEAERLRGALEDMLEVAGRAKPCDSCSNLGGSVRTCGPQVCDELQAWIPVEERIKTARAALERGGVQARGSAAGGTGGSAAGDD